MKPKPLTMAEIEATITDLSPLANIPERILRPRCNRCGAAGVKGIGKCPICGAKQ